MNATCLPPTLSIGSILKVRKAKGSTKWTTKCCDKVAETSGQRFVQEVLVGFRQISHPLEDFEA
jgi:hypothetical protein